MGIRAILLNYLVAVYCLVCGGPVMSSRCIPSILNRSIMRRRNLESCTRTYCYGVQCWGRLSPTFRSNSQAQSCHSAARTRYASHILTSPLRLQIQLGNCPKSRQAKKKETKKTRQHRKHLQGIPLNGLRTKVRRRRIINKLTGNQLRLQVSSREDHGREWEGQRRGLESSVNCCIKCRITGH